MNKYGTKRSHFELGANNDNDGCITTLSVRSFHSVIVCGKKNTLGNYYAIEKELLLEHAFVK